MELTGNIIGDLINNGSGNWNFTTNGLTYTFGQSSVVLSVTGVPEPSTCALIVLGTLALMIAGRKRWC